MENEGGTLNDHLDVRCRLREAQKSASLVVKGVDWEARQPSLHSTVPQPGNLPWPLHPQL